jgi:hypothetical protein
MATVKFLNLLKEILSDLKGALPYTRINSDEYEFTTGDLKISVEMQPVGADLLRTKFTTSDKFKEKYNAYQNKKYIYSVGYSVNGDPRQHVKTDLKTLLSIVKTVSAITEDFIRKIDPFAIMVFAMNKNISSEESDPQKTQIYKKILMQYDLSQYNIEDISTTINGYKEEGFILYKR